MVELYRRLWLATGKEQIILIVLSLLVAAIAAVPLQLQKDIINGLTQKMGAEKLFLLCGAYFAVLLINAGLKFLLNYRSSVLGESVIRRIRALLYREEHSEQQTGFDRSTLITKIADEANAVGKFAGEAIASPLLQVGTLISVVGFVAVTQPRLGLLIFLLILPQAFLVLYTQRFINTRVSERVKTLRQATKEISASDVGQIEQSVLDDFDSIFEKQREIFKIKLSVKFLLNALNAVGTVGILRLGGLLFIDGRTDIGTIVASLSAFQRINEPWRTLIAFYRQLSAVTVRFTLLLPKQNN